MKKRFLWAVLTVSLVIVFVLAPFVAQAQGSGSGKSSLSGPSAAFAQTISTVTGIAISPLLAMSAVGAWQFFKAPSEKRAGLPFYAQWWFWIPGLIIAAAAALKDSFGAATPPGMKKPFDVAEAVENKISGLVAAGALVPLVTSIFQSAGADSAGTGLPAMGFAAVSGSEVLGVLALPFALAAFVVVWLVSHAINVLILLSPWGGIDAALKAARTALLGSVALLSAIDPWVGAFLSLGVILIAWALAGWSFRLLVFGSVFCWDFFTIKRRRFRPGREVRAFTARKIDKVPIRTWGAIRRKEDGEFEFRFKPWLVMKERSLAIPAGNLAIGNALFYPALVRIEDWGERGLFNFPPRCRTHEAELAKQWGLETRDVGVIKGFKAAWRFMKEAFGGKTKSAPAQASA